MSQTPRQMASNQQRSLATMQRRLREMAATWGDLDTYNMERLEALADECASVSKMLVTDSVMADAEAY